MRSLKMCLQLKQYLAITFRLGQYQPHLEEQRPAQPVFVAPPGDHHSLGLFGLAYQVLPSKYSLPTNHLNNLYLTHSS
jgi:hypothetical protein